jgi:hypothetical protein
VAQLYRAMHDTFGYTPEQFDALSPYEQAERRYWIELMWGNDVARKYAREGPQKLTAEENEWIGEALEFSLHHPGEFVKREGRTA